MALFLVLAGGGAVAAFDPIGGDGDVDACFEKKSGDLDVLKGKKCGKGERPIAWDAADSDGGSTGEPGSQGPPGVQGTPGTPGTQGGPGQTGATGSPAASMVTGFVRAALLPPGAGTDSYFVPSGEADAVDEGGRSPNATVVLRDLSVEFDAAPGATTSWVVSLGDSQGGDLTCTVSGGFTRTCNSGAQTETIAPGSRLELNVANQSGAAPSILRYGYRATTP